METKSRTFSRTHTIAQARKKGLLVPHFCRLVALVAGLLCLFASPKATAQIFQAGFGTAAISGHPYNGTPSVLHPRLSNTQWTNSTNAWLSAAGAAGSPDVSLQIPAAASGTRIRMEVDIAASYRATINSFSFWAASGTNGPTAWTMSVNGIAAGSGTLSPGAAGANTGTLNVSTPVNDQTGRIRVEIELTGGSGGSFALDDFTLNGSVCLPAPTVNISSGGVSTICAGSTVNFSISSSSNLGATTPTYQWRVNGTDVAGATGITFSPNNLVNNDKVSLVVTRTEPGCSATATSNEITIAVNPLVVPSVSSVLVSPGTTVCAGQNVTFQANITGGGTTPSYQWQVNGVNAGTNSATFTTASLANGSQVRVILTSNATCASPNTATSAVTTMTVNPVLTPAVSIGSSDGDNSICAGTAVTFTATPTNGGATPSYQWQVNGVNAGTNSATFTTSTLANGESVLVIMTSNATCASPNPVQSGAITTTVIPQAPVSTTISATTPTTICSNQTVSFQVATANNAGTTPAYLWQRSINSGSTWTDESGTATTYTASSIANGTQFRVRLTSNAACATGNPAFSNAVSVTIRPDMTLAYASGSTSQTVCQGSAISNITYNTGGSATGATVTGLPAGVGGSFNSGVFTISGTPTVSGTFNYSVTPTGGCGTVAPLTGTITVRPTLAATISAAPTTICAGSSTTLNFTSGPSTLATVVGYSVNGGATQFANLTAGAGSAASGALSSNSTISLVSVRYNDNAPGCSQVVSGSVNVNVTPQVTPSVTISASKTQICATGDAVTFNATGSNGGFAPTYQWLRSTNNGSTWTQAASPFASYTDNTTTNYMVKVVMTTTATCPAAPTAESTPVTITAFNSLASATLTPNGSWTGSLCPSTNRVFTVNPVLGATSYVWTVMSPLTIEAGQGTNSATIGATNSGNNRTISVVATNACGSSPALSTNVNINSFSGADLGTAQSVCAGQSVNISARLLGNASSNNASLGHWSSSQGTFSNLSVTKSGPDDFVNVTFTPNAGFTGNAVASYQPQGTTCPNGTPPLENLAVTVRPIPSATIAPASPTICAGNPAPLTITGLPNTTVIYRVGAGANQSVNLGASGSANILTGILSASTSVTLLSASYNAAPACAATLSGAGTVANITVNPAPVVNAGAAQTVCAGGTITLAGTRGGSATSSVWSAATGTFSDVNALNATYTPAITTGNITLTLTSNDPDATGPCSVATSTMVVTVNPAPTVSVGAAQNVVCQSASPAAIALTGSAVGGSATSGTWSIVSGGGTLSNTAAVANPSTVSYTPAANYFGNVVLRLTTNDPDGAGPCAPVFQDLTITVNRAAVVNAGANQAVCGTGTFALNGSLSGAATSATWSAPSGTFTSPSSPTSLYTPDVSVLGTSVVLTLTSNDPDGTGPCQAATSTTTVNVSRPATANAGGPNTLCSSGSPTAFTLSGASFGGGASQAQWSITSGGGSLSSTALGANPGAVTYTPAAGFAGTVTLTLTTNDPDAAGPCAVVSSVRTITIDPAATASAGAAQTICSNSAATLNGSFGGTATSATWSTSGSGVFSNPAQANATYTPSAADIVSGSVTLTYTTDDPSGPCAATSSNVVVTIRKAPVITTQPGNTSVCFTFPTSMSVAASGDSLTYRWYKGTVGSGTPVSGATITGANSPTLNIGQSAMAFAGSYYVVVSGAGVCTPVSSNQVTLAVNQQINITQQPVAQTVCNGSPFTLTVAASAGSDPLQYQWYRNNVAIAGANSPSYSLANANHLQDGGEYYCLIDGPAGYACNQAFSARVIVTVTPPVSNLRFNSFTTPICQNPGTVTYTATANHHTGITYQIMNPAGAGTIDANTGALTFAPGFFGTATIRATATGCQGPLTEDINVVVTQLPTASISYSTTSGSPATAAYCMNNSTTQAVTLSGSGAFSGGIYSSAPAGLSMSASGTITPNTSTPDRTYNVSYTIAAAGGCPAVVATTQVRIDTLPRGGSIGPVVWQVCGGTNSGSMTLSNFKGSILRWESSTNAGATWTTINNTAATYSYNNLSTTSIFRAVVSNGACTDIAYSDLGAVSVRQQFTPTVTLSRDELCPFESADVVASGLPPISPLPVEDFQNANPAGWEGYDASGNNVDDNTNWNEQGLGTANRWQCGIEFLSQMPPTTSKFMIAKGITDNANQTATLFSPIYNLTNVSEAFLEFWHAGLFSAGASGNIDVSTDGGATWTTLKTYTSNVGNPTNGFVRDTILLIRYLGQSNLRVRFRYIGSPCSAWAIDNVGITNISPPVTYNWSPATYLNTTTGPNVTTTPTAAGPYDLPYTVTATVGGCPGLPVPVLVKVKPSLNLVPSVSSQPVCSNGSVPPALTISSNVDNTSYTWTLGALPTGVTYSGANTGSGSINTASTQVPINGLTGIFSNTTTSPQTVTLSITATASKVCLLAPVQVQIVVNPNPVVTLAGSYNCAANAANLTITTTSGATVSGVLQPGNIAFSGTGPSITLNPAMTSTTNFSISAMTVAGCSVASGVLPAPVQISTVGAGPAGLWVGTVDNDWFNRCNWANLTVPDNTVDVTIPGNAVRFCAINPNTSPFAAAYSNIARSKHILVNDQELRFGPSAPINSLLNVHGNLTLQNTGGKIDMQAGGEIELAGSWLNNRGGSGTTGFVEGQGTVELMGGAAYNAIHGAGYIQNIITVDAVETFHHLIMNNTNDYAARDEVTLLKAANVSGVFTLVRGRMKTTQTNLLTIINTAPAAVVGGANPNPYVNGPMARITNQTANYDFPVGKPDGPYQEYRPAIIQPSAANTITYNAEYFPYPTGPAANPYAPFPRVFLGIQNREIWEITRTPNSTTQYARVGLYYINPNNNSHWSNIEPCVNCNVAIAKRYTEFGNNWYFTNGQSTVTGFSSAPPEYRHWSDAYGLIWSKSISSFSPFTFGFDYPIVLGMSQDPDITLNLRLLQFNGQLQGSHDAQLSWVVSDNREVGAFELEYSTDGRSFRNIERIPAGSSAQYSYLHRNLPGGLHHYRLRMLDRQGRASYSKVVLLSVGKPVTIIKGLETTVVRNEVIVNILSANNQRVDTRLVTTNGRVVWSQRSSLSAGDNSVRLSSMFIPQGLYFLQVTTEDGVTATLKLMKE